MITSKASTGSRRGVIFLISLAISLALALASLAAPAGAQDTEPPPLDTAPPTVQAVSPADGTTTVHPADNVTATFSEPMNPATVDDATFTLTKRGAAGPVAATVGYDGASDKATLDPVADLSQGATYEARVATGATDGAGNPLTVSKSWSFRVS